MGMSRPVRLLILVCLLIPSAYFAWTFRGMPQLGFTGDDQIYLVSGKSLATGSGYLIPNLPGEFHQTRFPVLYPFLLSLIWRAAPQFPQNLPYFTLLSWLMVPVFLVAVKSTSRSMGFPEAESLLMCALLAVNPAIVSSAVTIGPDLMFATLLLAVFLLLHKAEQRGTRYIVLAGLLAGCAYLMRAAAIPLLVTVPLWLLWRRQRLRAGLFLAAMLPFALSWSIWARSHQAAGADPTTIFYADYFRDYILNFSWHSSPIIFVKNAGWVLEYSGLMVALLPAAPLLWACGILAIVGAVRLLPRTGLTQYHFFAVAYAAMLVFWTGKPLYRYVVPLAPLLVCGFVHSLTGIVGRVAPPVKREAALVTLGVLAAIGAVVGLPVHFSDLRRYQREYAAEQEAYAWIRQNLPPTASFLTYKEGVLYLETGLRATNYQVLKRDAYTGNTKAVQASIEAIPRFAKERGAEYAFCDSRMCPGAWAESDAPLIRAVLDKHYRQVFREGNVTIYRLLQ